jgi:hypothetical protein
MNHDLVFVLILEAALILLFGVACFVGWLRR